MSVLVWMEGQRQPTVLPAVESKYGSNGLEKKKHRVVVVVVDSHIQRIVLATEETTVT